MTVSPLNRKLLRDLATHWTQVAAIVIVVALGIIMFSGPLLAQRGLRDSINEIYRRTNYEDFSARISTPAPVATVAEFAAIPEVADVNGRLVNESPAFVEDTQLTLRVISLPDAAAVPGTGKTVDGLVVESGSGVAAGSTGTCVVEHHLSSEFGLEPGDSLVLDRNGTPHPLTIVGTVVSPEYLRLVSDPAEYVADPSQFGVIFVTYTDASEIFGQQGLVNDYVARVESGDGLQPAMGAATRLLEPYGLIGLTTGPNEPSAVILDLEIDDVGKLAYFFSVLMLAVASLALYVTMTQIVFSQQRQIGVTRAVGYERRDILTHYLGYGFVLGAAGGVLGVILGYYLGRLIIHIYAGIFDLPLIGASLYWAVVLAGVIVGIAFSIIGAVVPARHAVRMKPAEAMRVEAGLALGLSCKRPKRKSRLPLPSFLLISLRNLFRNRRRTLLTCLGVIATISLLVTATGGYDSMDFAIYKHLNLVLRWDDAVGFTAPVGPDMLERVRAMPGVELAEPAVNIPARLSFEGAHLDVQVQAYTGDSELHGSYPVEGSKGQPGPGEILLNRGITTRLPLKLGDRVTVNTSLGSIRLKVAGFVSEPFGGVCYVNMAYVQSLAGGDVFNVIVARVSSGNSKEVAKQMRALPGASRVITKTGILTVFEELVGAVKTLFLIFYVMAFSIGFAILFSMITVNLLERSREIATIRTLGAGRSRIFAFVSIETVSVVVAALVPGVILGRFLEWFVIEKLISSDRLAPDTIISGLTIIIIVLAALGVVVISELPSIRKLWRLDLARVTKERAD